MPYAFVVVEGEDDTESEFGSYLSFNLTMPPARTSKAKDNGQHKHQSGQKEGHSAGIQKLKGSLRSARRLLAKVSRAIAVVCHVYNDWLS